MHKNTIRVTEELVYTTAEDGLELAGVIIRPANLSNVPVPLVWVHGAGANFYMRPYVRLAHALAQRGYHSLIGNNRGHDFGFFVGFDNDQPRYAGQGWEYFDQSPRDIAGWITFLAQRGFAEVILVGHSLGAVKAVFYQAQRQDARVRGVVSASAPARLEQYSRIESLRALAAQMVRDGRGQDLLPWGSIPGGGTLSAQTYANRAMSHLDMYGLHTTSPLIAKINCPLLAIYGTNESSVGSEEDLDRARAHANPHYGIETELIEGANHVYADHEEDVARKIDEWIRKIVVRPHNQPEI
jgi:pimeloyl-ACP methyl ester carboxylesterase